MEHKVMGRSKVQPNGRIVRWCSCGKQQEARTGKKAAAKVRRHIKQVSP